MTFRSLDSDRDWTWGNGRQNYLVLEDAINENVRTALWVFRGEIFWNTVFGVNWWNLIGRTNAATTSAEIILQCRTMIVQCYGVAKINKVLPIINSRTRSLSVTYNISTIFSRSVTGAVQLPT